MKNRILLSISGLLALALTAQNGFAQEAPKSDTYKAKFSCGASIQGGTSQSYVVNSGDLTFFKSDYGSPFGSEIDGTFSTTFNVPLDNGTIKHVLVHSSVRSALNATGTFSPDAFPLDNSDIALVDTDEFRILSYGGSGGGNTPNVLQPVHPVTNIKVDQSYEVSLYAPVAIATSTTSEKSVQVFCTITFVSNAPSLKSRNGLIKLDSVIGVKK